MRTSCVVNMQVSYGPLTSLITRANRCLCPFDVPAFFRDGAVAVVVGRVAAVAVVLLFPHSGCTF